MDGEVRGEWVFVPPKEHAVGDRLNIHVRRSAGLSVVGRILKDFLMKSLVLAPAGDNIKFLEAIRKFVDVQVAVDSLRPITVLRGGLEILAD